MAPPVTLLSCFLLFSICSFFYLFTFVSFSLGLFLSYCPFSSHFSLNFSVFFLISFPLPSFWLPLCLSPFVYFTLSIHFLFWFLFHSLVLFFLSFILSFPFSLSCVLSLLHFSSCCVFLPLLSFISSLLSGFFPSSHVVSIFSSLPPSALSPRECSLKHWPQDGMQISSVPRE